MVLLLILVVSLCLLVEGFEICEVIDCLVYLLLQELECNDWCLWLWVMGVEDDLCSERGLVFVDDLLLVCVVEVGQGIVLVWEIYVCVEIVSGCLVVVFEWFWLSCFVYYVVSLLGVV